jgi:hypothetical protein
MNGGHVNAPDTPGHAVVGRLDGGGLACQPRDGSVLGGSDAAVRVDGCATVRPARLRPWASYPKEEIVEICGALALAESALARLGRPAEAAHVAAVFDMVEGRLIQ